MKNTFKNLDNIKNDQTFQSIMRWHKERRSKKKDLTIQIPQAANKQIAFIRQNRSKNTITWVGHSTFLIQINGINILTDPVWGKWKGTQKRLTKPGLVIEDLPEIDIVLISHGHYDHLEFGSIRKIKGIPTYYVPQGLKKLFVKNGYANTIEANWWDTLTYQELTLHFVPAQHWTRRGLMDTDTSHWGGWVIEDEQAEHSVYFVGDTGYFRGFKEIGEKFTLQYVLMPIGAYEPEWMMKVSHINPEDAVKAYLELAGTRFIPMHYGAYRLADDTGPEALSRLNQEWNRRELPDQQLKSLHIGQTLWMEKLNG